MSAPVGPVVDLRRSRASLVWLVLFSASLSLFLIGVFVSNLGEAGLASAAAAGLVVVAFTGVLAGSVAAELRSSVHSDGTALRVRSGFVTRVIPANDIEGFVILDELGRRRDDGCLRLGVALRSGSPTDLRLHHAGGTEWRTPLRVIRRVLTCRWGRGLPLPRFSLTRPPMEHALVDLARWHQWARRIEIEHK